MNNQNTNIFLTQHYPEIKFDEISVFSGDSIKIQLLEAIKKIQQTKNIPDCEKIIIDTIRIDK